jgi:hypothetical protein
MEHLEPLLAEQHLERGTGDPSEAAPRLLALALAAVAIGLVILEPFPKGEVLVSLTDTHGVDSGDIPALAMLLVAAFLVIRS